MVRRTISIPETIDILIRAQAAENESYSATVARIIERAAYSEPRPIPAWIGSFEGPGDLGIRAEDYLREFDTFD